MSRKSVNLLFLLLCLAAGSGALLFVSKDEGGAGLDEDGVGVAQSAAEPAQDVELEAFEGVEHSRDVAPSSVVNGQFGAVKDLRMESTDVQSNPFTGQVVGAGGQPVEGAEVRITPDLGDFPAQLLPSILGEADSVLTDSNGVFLVRSLPRGALKIEIKAPAYVIFSEGLSRPTAGSSGKPGAEPVKLGVFRLEPGVVLQGVVVDFFGVPVSGAELRVEALEAESPGVFFLDAGEGEPDGVSAEDGSFSLESVPSGPWSVTASHGSHAAKRVTGVSERVGLHPESLRIQLPESGVIRGLVRGAVEWSEFKVLAERIEGALGMTDIHRESEIEADGSFELKGLLTGESYGLFVLGKEVHGIFGEPLSPRVAARTGDFGVMLEMSGPTSLRFRVIDASTGLPIERFRAEAGAWGTEPLRGPDRAVLLHHPGGFARFEKLSGFDYGGEGVQLKVLAEGYEAYSSAHELVRGEDLDLGELRLKPAPFLELRVVSDDAGEPVHKAQVTLSTLVSEDPGFGDFGGMLEVSSFGLEDEGAERSGRTDQDGRLSLTTIPGERCVLSVGHPRFADLRLDPAVYGGGEMELRLLKGGAVRVLVQREGGGVGAGVEVSHHEPGGDYFSGFKADQDGIVLFDQLRPGEHFFRIEEEDDFGFVMPTEAIETRHGQAAGWASVEVIDGGAHELVLVQAARSVLYGRVTEAGRPLAGATLRLSAWSPSASVEDALQFFGGFAGGDLDSRSKGDGSYRMKEKSAGEYELLVSHATRAMQERFRVTLTPGEVEFNVDLSLTGISGVVLDELGQPVAGARVRVARPGGQEMSQILFGGSGIGTSLPMDGGGASTTSQDGSFQLKGLLSGEELELSVEKNPYQPARQSIGSLARGELRSGFEVTLERGGALRVQVLSPEGGPVEFASLYLSREVEGAESSSRDAGAHNGVASLEGLAPGEWKAEVTIYGFSGGREPDVETQERVLMIKAGETTDAVFQF